VAAMQQIADWLKKLGMSEYAKRFVENRIDLSVLPELTDQDLKDLGVLLGDRRKLLRAIRDLGNASGPVTAPSANAERRQLTVMFCDLVGSTALSTNLDPEDLRAIISDYQRCCTELVERNGGFVARYLGDGVLAYFGYPRADEHEAEHAVRAGLALVEAVSKLNTGTDSPLQVRVGIATGLVVVGDLIGTGAAQEHAVVGETPNLAARLQAVAEPSAVVISSSTRRLTSGLFEYRDLGFVALKGFTKKVAVWQVLRASAAESRFEALRATPVPLVGRHEEMELLLRLWQQAKRGEGCVALLLGEPGIGKSRLAVALQERVQGDPHTRLRHFCSPHHQDSALHPVIGQLERAAGLARDDTADAKLTKLETLLSQSNAEPAELACIAELLSLPNERRAPRGQVSPQKHKEMTLTALLAQMERLAARRPVLAIYEDVHWIDPTTLELLTSMIDRLQKWPVLLLVTARSEFRSPWTAYAYVINITLERIGQDDGVSLIGQVTRGKAVPGEIVQRILAHTDGVPLFIEELTKAVVESGVLTDVGDRYATAGPLPSLSVPTSLHASLLARLDRLPRTREVAQIGAALGRQFSHELISAVAAMPRRMLDNALAKLVAAELLFRRGTPPDAEYLFKHAFVQDTAYGTLLRAQRRQIHSRIAATLERRFSDIVTAHPQIAARHFTEAGLNEEAVAYWLKAGQQAAARSAMLEAATQLQKGLDLIT
jgi:class 3 adenylate cyclase